MDYSARVLGTGMSKTLHDRARAPLLRIGSDAFDRVALAHVECFNYVAAANLSAILNEYLRVSNTRDLFERIAPSALALPRLGAVALAVLGACFELKRIGGEAPLEAWVQRHAKKDAAHPLVTFTTIKHREALAAQRTRKPARRSKTSRLRLARFSKTG
jgi:hypothetical protein